MRRGLRKEWSFLAGMASIGLLLGRNQTGVVTLGLLAAGLRFWPAPAYSFRNRSVVITGGSRGLGLALAKGFLEEGANVTLLARDADELDRARKKLVEDLAQRPTGEVLVVRCDITRPEELYQALNQVEVQFGRIDILVNNAGSISVGPLETMEQADFTAQMELHLQAAINSTRHVLPVFRRLGEGRIVNICSIGGIIPVPHMSTYCISKFALSGFSQTLAAELAPDNITVTTVYPGMMRTGSPIQAVFKGNTEKEYAWFATGDVMPGLSVSAREAVRHIIEGVRHGDTRVTYPLVNNLGIFAHAVFPETFAFVARQAARLMPKSNSRVRKTGAQSQGWLESQRWYKPLQRVQERAEQQLNQQEKTDADFNLGVSADGALIP